MIINKENQKKLHVIASKMSKTGFGDAKSLYYELLERYTSLELKKLKTSS